MGEYYKPVNFTKKEYIHPHTLDCGLKLLEWWGYKSAVTKRMEELFSHGEWSKDDDIRAVSDYGDERQLFGEPTAVDFKTDRAFYHYVSDHFTEVSGQELPPQ